MLGFTCYAISFAYLFFMKTKDEAPSHLERYLQLITARGFGVERIRMDSDTIFKSEDMRELLGQYMVTAEYANPHTPTENGLQERTWGMLMPVMEAMLQTAQLPKTCVRTYT